MESAGGKGEISDPFSDSLSVVQNPISRWEELVLLLPFHLTLTRSLQHFPGQVGAMGTVYIF